MFTRTRLALTAALLLHCALGAAQTPPAAAQAPASAAAPRPFIKVAPDRLSTYVGRYMIDPQHLIDVTLEGEQLFGQGSGLPKMQLFASTPTLFFVNELDAQLDFSKAEDGSAQMVLISGGRATPGKKVN
jgi:D-alanyl-D-alanine-carboxypeptidase/D-alanyl-D-alanine-endopeptidase